MRDYANASRPGSSFSSVTGARESRLRLRWRAVGIEETPEGIIMTLGRRDGVLNVSWFAGDVDAGSDGG